MSKKKQLYIFKCIYTHIHSCGIGQTKPVNIVEQKKLKKTICHLRKLSTIEVASHKYS